MSKHDAAIEALQRDILSNREYALGQYKHAQNIEEQAAKHREKARIAEEEALKLSETLRFLSDNNG